MTFLTNIPNVWVGVIASLCTFDNVDGINYQSEWKTIKKSMELFAKWLLDGREFD